MCGIAGMIDLAGGRPPPPAALRAMAAALAHRGPDEDGFLEQPGLGLASRRLSIVGLADGRQPVANEDGSVCVVFNGEAFDYPELRAGLEGRGHRFRTHCDTEVVVHLYEELQDGMLARLRGQFALALWDARRRRLLLARDRLGICPLYWTRQKAGGGEWLLFASEIKGLLASGMVPARPDVRGIDHAFTFFALPGAQTCFEGVRALPPGHALTVQSGGPGGARVSEAAWWDLDFPAGDGPAGPGLVDAFEAHLVRAVRRRLRGDVPVAGYLSGGVDSTLIATMARRLGGRPLTTFTLQIQAPGLDESAAAARSARVAGTKAIIVPCAAADVLAAYPRLVWAAEAPVSDTCCAALLLLAQAAHARGFKVVLTGEGADELLAGYPWHKLHRLLALLDRATGLPLGRWGRDAFFRRVGGRAFSARAVRRAEAAVGGHHAWLDPYTLAALGKPFFYGPRMREALAGYEPYEHLGLDVGRLRRWQPLHQSLAMGLRVHLPGLLLSLGGDRVAMHSSVETRYPFLDEDLFDFLARLPPGWKLHGLRDKYLLRRAAQRWLPRDLAWKPKTMFRAPFDVFASKAVPACVEQLLSPASLRATGYFDPEQVARWRQALPQMRRGGARRFVLGLGLAGVAATQLWHHTFLGPTLCDLPGGPAPSGPR
jgi:asparagine synthase (glutamine-hydrolysing)